jgi:hypothetical protein
VLVLEADEIGEKCMWVREEREEGREHGRRKEWRVANSLSSSRGLLLFAAGPDELYENTSLIGERKGREEEREEGKEEGGRRKEGKRKRKREEGGTKGEREREKEEGKEGGEKEKEAR